jgi:hypothetical protein
MFGKKNNSKDQSIKTFKMWKVLWGKMAISNLMSM